MIDPERYERARLIAGLAGHKGFQELFAGAVTAEREGLESGLIQHLADKSSLFCRTMFTEWQTAKRIESAMLEEIKNAARYLREVDEETENESGNERAIASDRSSRDGWNA